MCRRIRKLIAITLLMTAAMLSACRGNVKPSPPVIPKVVTKVVKEYIPVPAELTAPCMKFKRKSNLVQSVVEALNHDENYLDACSARMRQIRNLPLTPAPATSTP